jgi:protein SDA1
VTADRTSSNALWAVKLTRELWKRQIWTETKPVEIMKECCLADNEKVIVGGVRFFLGGDKEREDQEDSSDEEVDFAKIKHQMGINKKTKKRSKALDQAVDSVKRKERKKNRAHPLNFSAFHLLNDPQGFAETLFSKHLQNTKSKLNLEQRLLVLQLVTRLIGLHKLTVISLYSYFIKYLTPRQPSVTSFLASLAQASHNLVPPDSLEPLIQKIANEFVSEASASEVASAGLNAIREVCMRQPLAMNETLLQDLIQYRKSKDKGVMMAARGLLSLYREVNPEMLPKKDRGKEAALGLRSGERKERRFGEEAIGEIEGLELLEKWKEAERERKKAEKGVDADSEGAQDDEDEDAAGWEVSEDSESDDSGGWINVESDEDIVISDSDDDVPKSKRTKISKDPEIESEEKENVSEVAAELEKRISSLATTKILTPADLAKLQELRLEASVNKALPAGQRKRLAQQATAAQQKHIDDGLTADDIEGLAMLSKKATKEDKIAKAKEGKTDRLEHKSSTAIRKSKKEAAGKSSTNKEKARKKNLLMTLGKAKRKNKRSLVERSKILKAHKEREKRGGRRGNN